jgi:signal transduction histidine kinase
MNSPADPAKADRTAATILVVDDEPANIAVLDTVLRPHFRVRVARSGADALRAAGTEPHPDLILLDVMMPEMDGYAVLAKLRQSTASRDIPVIFVTAMVSSEDEQRGLELGAVDYITKPITPAIVLARVRTQLEARQARDLLKKLNLQLVHQVAQGVHALELAQQQLLQSEKMAAIGQLAAGVAHEINNPLGYVSSNLGTLRQYLTGLLQLVDAYRLVTLRCAPDDSALLEANRLAGEFDLEYVRDDAPVLLAESTCGLDRIRRIVSDLKDFSHVDAVVWEPFDLHACLESTLNVVWNELKYKVTLVKEYGDLPAITGLPHQLSQVFMNLLINAAQAIVEHGTITLRTGCAADSVWIEVEDSGVGIAPENLPRIFEPFFTTKPVGSGTGLGMAVSYSIVQKHQGSIDIRSEVGQGTTVRVNLPIHPAGVDSQAGLPA